LKAMRTESLPRAAAAAEKFLQTQMQPRDLVALMTFDDAITVVEDFTADRDALIQEVKKLAASGVAQSADDSVAERRPQDLLPLIRMVGVLKEKKLVMYFADAAPLRSNDSDTQAKLQDVIQAAIRANVAFYPIDTRGLIVEKPPALEKEPPQARVRGVAWSRMSQRQWQPPVDAA
jgi:VWFA-related protein